MITHRIRVYGIVQGVGFRPFVSRTCKELGLNGTVANKGSYVEIFAQGEHVPDLITALHHTPPARAVILNILEKQVDLPEFGSFEIIESERDEGEIFVSPDIAICEECKTELFDKNNRRYMHPFINCTNCGPRLTILDSMPYDRERTSMKSFPMCPECEYEYTHPETRRYDAQPVCCPNCGPTVYAFDPKNTTATDIQKSLDEYYADKHIFDTKLTAECSDKILIGRSAISTARKAITNGKIVAIKGIGGFHLCCDAKNEEAVSRLRMLKNRPMKPFAVMMKDMDTVQRECVVSMHELLTGHQKPIVLLEKKADATIAEAVAPGNPKLGVMLPYTPIHLLLFDYDDEYKVPDCLIMTSANASGAPICRTDTDAIEEIADFTDLVLSNNRTILTRADDTVTDIYEGKPYMIRRSRGFAPLPVMINSHELQGTVLGIGGELKNTFCIARDSLLYPSAYVGDMADIRTVNALEESVKRMEDLFEAKPSIVVADLHPKYNTTAVAEDIAMAAGIPVVKIQHHYAHILSCMAENDYLDEVIGVSFDGTGYGTDGTIWGGEYLRCRLDGFDRLGSITPFIQCGGDLSSREGWRIAVSILGDFLENKESTASGELTNKEGLSDIIDVSEKNPVLTKEYITQRLELCTDTEYDMLSNMARAGINSITSTSAGRLFDAVSAVLGIRRSSTFEGEAATALMFEAESYRKEKGVLFLDGFSNTKWHLAKLADTNTLVKLLAKERISGEPANKLAMLFHLKLAEMIAESVLYYSEETGIKTAALSGGVFQNTLLLEFVEKNLTEKGIQVLRHSQIPPNDGGIAVGQALYGLAHLGRSTD